MPFYSSVLKRSRHNAAAWRYVFNMRSTLAYWRGVRPLAGEIERVVSDLRCNGLAITNVKELFSGDDVFNELSEAVARIECEQQDRISAARAKADQSEALGEKAFIHTLLGERPKLLLDSVFARFALQEPILQIANAYFRMLTQLRYYNVWRTFRTAAQAHASQLWHRDREDLQILKLFVHLSDIDDGAGPFTYAPGTHLLGPIKGMPESFLEGGVERSRDDQMAQIVPRDRWIVGRGARGTIIFADTHGYHKGGLARERERLFYTCMFTSPGSQCKDHFDRSGVGALPASRALALAVSPPGQSRLRQNS